jgi:hypothetical protein
VEDALRVAEAPVLVLGHGADVLDVAARVDDEQAIVLAEAAQVLGAAQAALEDRLPDRGQRPSQNRILAPHAFMLEDIRLGTQGGDETVTRVDREDLLDSRRTADQKAIDAPP